jgi:elongation factor 2
MSSDGTLIIVDSIESVCWTLERSLQYTIPSGVKPVLFINKIDRMFIELQLPAEDIYNSLVRIVESCNVAIATYQNDKLPNMQLCPVIGSVCFGSGKMGWGFTIKTFAKMYAKKFGIDEDRLATKLWGDNYFDPKNKKWVKSAQNGDDKPLKRAFCQFIIEPIYQIANAIMMDNHESLAKILLTLGVSLSEEEKRLQHRQKFQVVMKCLFPLNALLLDMLVEHLPSPVEAQQYRNVYKQQDYIYSQSIRACDPEGPLMIYVIIDFNASYAFGRIFSGKVRRGHIVRIVNGEKAETRVDLTGYLEQVSCGNYVVICGEGLTPKCTLADKEAYNCGEITLEINEK